MTEEKNRLYKILKETKKAAIAFSGGVDSVYLLYAAIDAGADVTAYYVRSDFQPEFEAEDAVKAAKLMNARMKMISAEVLSDENIRSNPADRCYFCKNKIFSGILKAAKEDGYDVIFDGTNASDDASDRPGMRALKEMKVVSPLREAGLTKKMIRALSEEAGLFTYSKPSYACLATRIPTGCEITKEKLEKTEKAESFMHALGFSDFRVRMMGEAAKLQVRGEQFPMLLEKRDIICKELKKYYSDILLDLEERK